MTDIVDRQAIERAVRKAVTAILVSAGFEAPNWPVRRKGQPFGKFYRGVAMGAVELLPINPRYR